MRKRWRTWRRGLVEPLLAQVRAHGFHGFRLDLREDAAVHTRALHDLTAAVGLGELDGAALRRELAGRRPLHASHVTLAAPTDRALEVFRVMRAIQDEIGGGGASTYNVSRTQSADDLFANCCWPAKEGWRACGGCLRPRAATSRPCSR